MTHESLRAAWDAGRAAIGGWVSGGQEFSLDLYRRAGYDYVGIDCQHAPLHEVTAASILQRTPPGAIATIVRVSKNDSALIGKLADGGADGVIVPMVDTPEQAAAAVAAANYPPHGLRSFGPMRPDLRRLDLPALAARVSVFAMIETITGLANVEAICQVPGLAGVYVGPADLSVGLGLNPLQAFSTDQLVAPIERIRRACELAGIVLGMHQIDGPGAVQWIERGVRLASLGTDGGLFLSAAIADRQACQGVADSDTGEKVLYS